jgi:hypothetical protein
MNHIEGDPRYITTFRGAVNFASHSGTIEYFGRIEGDTLVSTQSYKNTANQFPPASILYAPLTSDAVGDTAPGSLGAWLDLTGSGVTFSDTRIYARLNNASGTWPLNQGLTRYFIYGFVLANPDTLTLSALALIYANVPLFISSGLYSVNLMDTSFSRIAAISNQVSADTLHMACNISDIISDPLFPSWPPQSGHVITGGFTLTVDLGNPGFNDYTYPASFIPESQFLAVTGNSAPILTNVGFDIIPNVTVNAHVDYFDLDGNLPVRRLLYFDNDVFEMGAFDHTYNDTARFSHLMTWPGAGEHYYYFMFTDGRDTVSTALDTLNLSPSAVTDEELPVSFDLTQNYPNPFNSQTTVSFSLTTPANIDLVIYDIGGHEVTRLAEGRYAAGAYSVVWDGHNQVGHPVSSGVYFYQLIIDERDRDTKRMLLLK